MKKYIALFILLIFIAGLSNAQNRSIEFHHGTFKEILASAKKENKMIFIDCFTTWCGPCKFMSKNIFTNDSVADFYNQNFINAKIDMEKGEGLDIAKKYQVRNYPTMLYLNAEGLQLHRVCGSSENHEFIENGRVALDPAQRLATRTEKFRGGKVGAEYAGKYFSLLEGACLSKKEALSDYFNHVDQQEFSSKGNWEIIEEYVTDYFSEPFQNFEKEKDVFSKQYGVDVINEKITKVTTMGLYAAIDNNDMIGYSSIKEKLLSAKTNETDKIILESEIYKSQKQKDWKNYASNVLDYMSRYSPEEANELNNYAWTFYEHVDDAALLSKAASWAMTACQLENNYANNDTYAAVLFKLGKKQEARAAADKAIAIAQESNQDFEETEALLVKINSLPE